MKLLRDLGSWKRMSVGALFRNLRTAHVYGGSVLIVAGVGVLWGTGAALLAGGTLIWYMGVFRMGRLR